MKTKAPCLLAFVILTFLVNSFGPVPQAEADDFHLPAPGVMVRLSPPLAPPILKGIKVHPENPFRFDFVLDKGDSELSGAQLKDESTKLIKYFLASLTIPEKDLWVNLSPYEKDRIIPQSFGLTEMGRDLLAEDYMLKQITASLIYPGDTIGKEFWKRIYEEAAKRFGTTNIPVNTFNKVWIVPEKAIVYENAKAGTVYVVESKLKVMLEQDYLSLAKHEGIQSGQAQVKGTSQLGNQIVREIVIPQLTKEVNEDKNFAGLRQVYNSLILATWYKKRIRDSILEQVYANRKKVAGVKNDDPKEIGKIYQRYLKAFKKGVYNYVREEVDPVTQETIPRKYFSGGETFDPVYLDKAMNFTSNEALLAQVTLDHAMLIKASIQSSRRAVTTPVFSASNSAQGSGDYTMLNPIESFYERAKGYAMLDREDLPEHLTYLQLYRLARRLVGREFYDPVRHAMERSSENRQIIEQHYQSLLDFVLLHPEDKERLGKMMVIEKSSNGSWYLRLAENCVQEIEASNSIYWPDKEAWLLAKLVAKKLKNVSIGYMESNENKLNDAFMEIRQSAPYQNTSEDDYAHLMGRAKEYIEFQDFKYSGNYVLKDIGDGLCLKIPVNSV